MVSAIQRAPVNGLEPSVLGWERGDSGPCLDLCCPGLAPKPNCYDMPDSILILTMHWSVIDLPWLLQASGFCLHELWLALSRSSVLALSCSYHGPGLPLSWTASSALRYNLSVLAQICSCWFFFGVCPGLPCLVLFSAHVFLCSIWLCMPFPELLAQDAAVNHRKFSVLARLLSVI